MRRPGTTGNEEPEPLRERGAEVGGSAECGPSSQNMPPGGSGKACISWSTLSKREGEQQKDDPSPCSPLYSRRWRQALRENWKTWRLWQWEIAQDGHLGSGLHVFPVEKVLTLWLYKGQRLKAKLGFVCDHLFYQQHCNTMIYSPPWSLVPRKPFLVVIQF